MDIGIGLPATIPGVPGSAVVEWARRADGLGFSSLGTIDRLVYGNYEPLLALAAAAAVTGRIRLTTSILIAPLRGSGAMLAKQADAVHRLSGGRLTLGMAVGGRQDDYEAAGIDFHRRGRLFDEQLETLEQVYGAGDGPEIIIGGTSDASYRRVGQYGAGWISGGGGAPAFAGGVEKARAAWAEAGRDGSPRVLSLGYYSLGPHAEENAATYLGHYYGFLPDEYVQMIVRAALTDEDAIREYVAGFVEAGCDELILFPCAPDALQVDLLARVVL
jgi:alkanesulfonate monooxygenase SsuD/methylene tetrahydromethanopterin reductase-like flavin-dependent oxidoreductase (luciferase family)